jgi:hypothetical protein
VIMQHGWFGVEVFEHGWVVVTMCVLLLTVVTPPHVWFKVL